MVVDEMEESAVLEDELVDIIELLEELELSVSLTSDVSFADKTITPCGC